MPPKNKAKKGKKADDEEYWEKAGESIPSSQPVADAPSRSGFSGFTALDMSVDDTAQPEEDEDFGGLMSTLNKATKSKKDKKKDKKKAVAYDEDEDTPLDPAVDDEAAGASKKPTEMTAEELADEEWGPVKEKKKGKKGKGKKSKAQDDEDEDKIAEETTEAAPPATAKPPAPADDGDDNADDDAADAGPKILSKKEKEKIKKEKERAKKKAQAAAKKSTTGDAAAGDDADVAPAAPPPADDAADNEDDADEGAAGKGDAKKKKKKKAKKEEEPAPAPPAASKKKGGAIGALKAMLEEKKRAEEEVRRKEEEERARLEREEQEAAEVERKKEEEKQRRKQKEKDKKELAKKEGRFLTKKQKEEKAMAEIRRQALLASGAHIEGLQGSTADAPVKKVNYGTRKKKGPAVKDASPAPESRPRSPEPVVPAPEPRTEPVLESKPDVVSDWDASSAEEENEVKQGAADVKDSWDASSDEEEVAPVVAPKSVGASKPVAAAKPAVVASSSKAPAKAPAKAPTPAVKKGMKAEAAARRAKAREDALAARSKDDLRSPICCILGHVDTGKTKLLDKIRQTNVQEGEAGGITQQIGATYFPVDAIKTKTAVLNKDGTQEYKIPGLLVIDTPGHESFTNLRSRGSSLCNIAILVVDIMHGLEQQTLESLRLLRDRKTPFIVALNKIDRMYGWDATPDGAFRESLAKQNRAVQREFEDRLTKIVVAFAEEGLNAVLYYDNKNFARNVSIVPTSAVTGEGVPDMIMLLVNLTQQRMSDRLMYLSELECTVLEVKVIEGLGTTIDVVLSNGILREGDKIVVCGLNGPIVTQIRALLTPQPLRELRIKSNYVHHKEVKAALGVKITAPDLEKAIAGSRLLVCGPDDDEDDLRDEVMSDLTSLLNNIDKSGRGVCVQASTLGSLEALLDFLKSSKIPVSGINIGPVHKKDVMRAGTMLEKAKELACILCFDVTVDKDAERMAEEMGIRLFKADIIYHLFDAFTAYNQEIVEAKRKDAAPQAVWPCRLKILAVFCKRDPIIVGVDILDGSLRVGTPLAVVKTDPATGKKEIIDLGKITSLEINHKAYDLVKKSQAGAGVAVKIEHAVYQSAKMVGRHFDEKDELLSHITRQSVDVLKDSFRADVLPEEWMLIKALKPWFNIQ
ncbi:unnamed protein product [Mycena citricolor]|uniref:Eukaryotic translation initiation factor 5B n=1 Tax=Mycena citricolor TaxID=2018698 RepID=A0AAD2GSS4_9AGAR|nr:unnamed protein product [Mycena citricolor]